MIKMEFIDVITERYSVRGYLDKEVEKEKLEYVLKAATLAPTGDGIRKTLQILMQQ